MARAAGISQEGLLNHLVHIERTASFNEPKGTHMHRKHIARTAILAIASTVLMACPKDKDAGSAESATASGSASAQQPAAAGGEQTPDAGRQVVVVKMISDGASNRFEPATFEVHQGDVIRYTLESGVHNVHFLADSNPGKVGSPAAPSDFLQLPGQTYDVKVSWKEGTYYFQCDPHAALGMIGHVKVED